jgi:hypothetical protein
VVNSDDLREKLAAEVGTVSWPLLRPHHERQSVFLVDQQLDLVEVAVGAAADQVEQIRDWLQAGRLARPSRAQVDSWEEQHTSFACVIIQPFVFIQLVC